mmetsp:Transcript_26313/g.75460  ORF Transcript_26313/g.75460 Transcript_26313/m.75460 type:complete len:216 (+) Transcript_26313:1363-2010(+)
MSEMRYVCRASLRPWACAVTAPSRRSVDTMGEWTSVTLSSARLASPSTSHGGARKPSLRGKAPALSGSLARPSRWAMVALFSCTNASSSCSTMLISVYASIEGPCVAAVLVRCVAMAGSTRMTALRRWKGRVGSDDVPECWRMVSSWGRALRRSHSLTANESCSRWRDSSNFVEDESLLKRPVSFKTCTSPWSKSPRSYRPLFTVSTFPRCSTAC